MKGLAPTVFVVDDDKRICKSLERLIISAGFHVKLFFSSEEFLRCSSYNRPGCLVLDINMKGLNGLELQKDLLERKILIPIIFITGDLDINNSIKAMKRGAIDFLIKPFNDIDLIRAIDKSIAKDTLILRKEQKVKEIQKRVDTLTSREQQVMGEVIKGLLNKQIAYKLGISEKTVKVHRGRVMQKMGLSSVVELVRKIQIIDN